MRVELKAYDRRDSAVFRHSLSMSRRTIDLSQDSKAFKDAFRHEREYVKGFREKLTLAGKHVGRVQGTVAISNIPLLHQMSIGTLTEKGIVMLKAPVFQQEPALFSFMRARDQHPKIEELGNRLKRLKELEGLSGVKAIRAFQEKTDTLTKVILILKERKFTYSSDASLMAA